MSLFNLSFFKLIEDNLPVRIKWKGVRHKALLYAFIRPIEQLRNNIFNTYVPDVMERAKYNGRVMVMEAVLNKVMNTTDVVVQNNEIDIDGFWIGEETDPLTSFISDDNEIEDYIGISYLIGQSNFTIYIPMELDNDDDRNVIADYVEKIKVYGPSYDIQLLP